MGINKRRRQEWCGIWLKKSGLPEAKKILIILLQKTKKRICNQQINQPFKWSKKTRFSYERASVNQLKIAASPTSCLGNVHKKKWLRVKHDPSVSRKNSEPWLTTLTTAAQEDAAYWALIDWICVCDGRADRCRPSQTRSRNQLGCRH